MRDPNRISDILFLLEKAWLKYPDLRLCQLVYILANPVDDDVFNIEDDRIIAALDKFLKENK